MNPLKWRKRKAKKNKKSKRVKPVRKNTWPRNLKAWMLRLDRRQQRSQYLPETDDTERACHHCGTHYRGRFCPQCGLPGQWRRFTWKQLFLNFMDIWGLGNRPMYRSLRDLFWRPGYMIRDYLGGHHLSYFPPFKMLALLTVLFVFVAWIVGAPMEEHHSIIRAAISGFGEHLSPSTLRVLESLGRVSDYVNDHMLYNIIVQNVFVVLVVYFSFRKISRYNLVETFFSQIYIHCQFQILAVASMLLTWQINRNVFFPYAVGEVLAVLVLSYDFHQLYGIRWKKSFWKTIAIAFNVLLVKLVFYLVILLLIALTEFVANPGRFIN